MNKTQGVKDQPIEWQKEFFTGLAANMTALAASYAVDDPAKQRAENMLAYSKRELIKLSLTKQNVRITILELVFDSPVDEDGFPLYHLPEEKTEEFYNAISKRGIAATGVARDENFLFVNIAHDVNRTPEYIRDVVQDALGETLEELTV
jgi:hypothetical protein